MTTLNYERPAANNHRRGGVQQTKEKVESKNELEDQ